MIDRILVILALAGLITFCGILLSFVAVPDLIIVVSICLLIAAYDFWVSVIKPGAGKD